MLCLARIPNPTTTFAGVFAGVFASVLAVMASSCERSPVDSEAAGAASAGAGGSGSASTAASGEAGGAGGSPTICTALALSGEPITYEPSPSDHGSRPSLLPASEDGSLVSVVFSRASIKEPDAMFPRIASAAFAPWGIWPKSLGAGAQASIYGGDVFAAAPAMPAGQPGSSILFYLPTNSFPSDMYFAPVVSVGTSYEGFPLGVSWDSWEPAWPVALARGASGHLASYQLGMGASAFMSLALVDAGSLAVSVLDNVACSSGSAPFAAAVVPAAGGFLVATAAGSPFGECLFDASDPGPAKDLHVIRFDEATKGITLMASFEGTDPIAHIALAKREEGGAWLVWQETGASALLPPPIHAVPLDESGAPAGPLVDITGDGQSVGPFAAAALGSQLAVA